MEILALLIFTYVTQPSWCGLIPNKDTDVLDQAEIPQEPNHSHTKRDGRLFTKNIFELGDIVISGQVQGNDVSIGAKVDIGTKASSSESNAPLTDEKPSEPPSKKLQNNIEQNSAIANITEAFSETVNTILTDIDEAVTDANKGEKSFIANTAEIVSKAIDRMLVDTDEAVTDANKGGKSLLANTAETEINEANTGNSEVEMLNEKIKEFEENIKAIIELKTDIQTIEDEIKTLPITQETRVEKSFLPPDDDPKSPDETRLILHMSIKATEYLEGCSESDICEANEIQDLKEKANETFGEIKKSGTISEQFKNEFYVEKSRLDATCSHAEEIQTAKKKEVEKQVEEAKAAKEDNFELYVEDCSSCKFVLNWGNTSAYSVFPGCSSCKVVFNWGSFDLINLTVLNFYDHIVSIANDMALHLWVAIVREMVRLMDRQFPFVGKIVVQMYNWYQSMRE